MTSISKNIKKLDDIVNKYNNTHHSIITIKPFDVKSGTNIYYDKKNDKENPKFKVGDQVRISNYKNIFTKGYVPNLSEEAFMITKVKNTVRWTYGISDLKGEAIDETFYEKELQKRKNQKEFRI